MCSQCINFYFNWGLFIWAVTTDRIIETSLGYYINPLVSFVLGVALLGERLSRLQMIAIALALAPELERVSLDARRDQNNLTTLAFVSRLFHPHINYASKTDCEALLMDTSAVTLPFLNKSGERKGQPYCYSANVYLGFFSLPHSW